MEQRRWTFSKFLPRLVLISVLSVVCLHPTPVAAQSWWEKFTALFGKNEQIGDARGRSRGAAVRDPDLCPYTQTPLTALVPNRNEVILTSKDKPSFWFYVPYQLTSEPSEFILKFVLQDDKFNDIYSATFVMPDDTEPGILSLQPTAEKAALEVDKTYRWYFLVYCDDEQQIYEPAFVEGWIRRGNRLQAQVDNDNQLDLQTQFRTYAESKFWYEAFDTLALHLWTNPNDIDSMEGWEQTLQTIELESLVEKTIRGRYVIPDSPE